MKKITITVVFNVSGHGSIGISPTHYSQWIMDGTGSRDFNLDLGPYILTYLVATASPVGGGSITITDGTKQLGHATLAPGVAGGTINFTV
ncbi:hypothetical protein ACFGVS_18645 [Mucilaginibacter sp. AW1-7]|uniref:hypothetical protein n=1 Tax=Mucilaginibacter sp. AW1-7 TaxID=3349874 RepID=UPI003F73A6A6